VSKFSTVRKAWWVTQVTAKIVVVVVIASWLVVKGIDEWRQYHHRSNPGAARKADSTIGALSHPAAVTTRRAAGRTAHLVDVKRKAGERVSPNAPRTVVVLLDATASLTDQFRTSARDAVAAGIERLVHDPQGPVTIYLRRIDHSSGSDSAAIASFHIDAVESCEANPFDQRCRLRHEAELAHARRQAHVIAGEIRNLRLTPTSAGTSIRGAFAAAGAIFANQAGSRILVVASDLRPSHASAPSPAVNLHGVRATVLFSCRQPIAVCQTRQIKWAAELIRDGVRPPIHFLTTQQASLLFTGTIGG
jgi:hypothetical protein